MAVRIQELAASRTERVAAELVELARETPEERAGWTPVVGGRSITEHVVNAAVANARWARILASRGAGNLEAREVVAMLSGVSTLGEACELLATSSRQLAATQRAVPDADLALAVRAPWWPEGQMLPLAGILGEATGNMDHCSGRVSEIQELAGCREPMPALGVLAQD